MEKEQFELEKKARLFNDIDWIIINGGQLNFGSYYLFWREEQNPFDDSWGYVIVNGKGKYVAGNSHSLQTALVRLIGLVTEREVFEDIPF